MTLYLSHNANHAGHITSSAQPPAATPYANPCVANRITQSTPYRNIASPTAR